MERHQKLKTSGSSTKLELKKVQLSATLLAYKFKTIRSSPNLRASVAPIHTYILGAASQETVKNYPSADGCELAGNITYLGKTSHIKVSGVCPKADSPGLLTGVPGRRGVFTGVSGLQIAYVSGQEARQEPALAHCFTSEDLTALVVPLINNPKFRGVDILLTSQWPRGVWLYGSNPVRNYQYCCFMLEVTAPYMCLCCRK